MNEFRFHGIYPMLYAFFGANGKLDRDAMRRQVARTAGAHGHFSIWMKVFADDVDMRRRFIREFSGTAKECFDETTTIAVTPRPDNDLAGGGRV